MFTWASLPGIHSIQGETPLNKSSESLERKRISPIQMNMGRAARAQECPAPHTVVAITSPTGAELNSTMPTKPMIKSDRATHNPLPSRANSKKINTIEYIT
jgi:hypothetical protein